MPASPVEESIWDYLTGCDQSGRRYSLVRVRPDVAADADIILYGGILKYRIMEQDPPHLYAAYEANGGRGITTGRVVRMSFAGIREDDGEAVPVFVFQ